MAEDKDLVWMKDPKLIDTLQARTRDGIFVFRIFDYKKYKDEDYTDFNVQIVMQRDGYYPMRVESENIKTLAEAKAWANKEWRARR